MKPDKSGKESKGKGDPHHSHDEESLSLPVATQVAEVIRLLNYIGVQTAANRAALEHLALQLETVLHGVVDAVAGVRHAVDAQTELLTRILAAVTPKPASRFWVSVASEAIGVGHPKLVTSMMKGDTPMPQYPIEPNSRAVVTVVPLSVDGVPTALDGNLQAIFPEPAVYMINNADPLSIIVKVDPPADLDAQPVTTMTISDDADSDPTLEISFQWTKGVVVVKATQFSAVVSSEPLTQPL